MSANKGKSRRCLDALLNSRWALRGPLLLAAAVLVLFAVFGTAQGKTPLLAASAFGGMVCFFGVFFVLWFQLRRMKDPAFASRMGGPLDAFVLLVLFVLTVGSAGAIVPFLADFQRFQPGTVLVPMAWAGVAWAHQKRGDR